MESEAAIGWLMCGWRVESSGSLGWFCNNLASIQGVFSGFESNGYRRYDSSHGHGVGMGLHGASGLLSEVIPPQYLSLWILECVIVV